MMLDEMVAHATEESPNEACGLVVASGKKHRLIRARNVAAHPRQHFDLDPAAWMDVLEHEAVIGIYHSHPHGPAEPSLADRTSCEASGLPWHIVNPAGDYRRIEPCGFRAPYLKRPYIHAIHDCYALVRDWYNWEWGLGLPDYPRDDHWWEKGQNLYLDHFAEQGFLEVADEPRAGDAFLVQVNSKVPNHALIFLGDGTILHHVQDRLSSRDVWGGYWARNATQHLRHNCKMGTTNG